MGLLLDPCTLGGTCLLIDIDEAEEEAENDEYEEEEDAEEQVRRESVCSWPEGVGFPWVEGGMKSNPRPESWAET